ncbi:flagellar motor protein MotB [Consotaella salsifontis]|uniref:Chemotaxis protein MotB n=1 Tax=Consotaella salsifontis TaxID=1365950 RepID=A0A1T4NRX9_9HYPH|nr:flagellar motor protein MotB [Consotaella salsifontis]SJZ81954.1 chemotaxis protein MotB [Consotaella salsifontis]
MSETNPHAGHGEIIIVKRGHDDHEEHHGGVWKIAFADFMTAMMAFFLVMWLTNASDDATKKQIAQYFNPIKLNDATPSARGLKDGNAGEEIPVPERGAGNADASGEGSGKPVAGPEKGGDAEAIFSDPYAVLAEIAAEGGPGTGEKLGAEGQPNGNGMPGLNGGEAYRDPFDPSSWQLQPNAVASAKPGTTQVAPPEFKTTVVVKDPPKPSDKPDTAEKTADAESKADKPKDEAAKQEQLKQDLEKQIAEIAPGLPANVQVSQGNGGVIVSIADEGNSGMFEIGSAKPTAATINMMAEIARILSTRKGSISLRGYTDGRQYKDGASYDNWRLSTDRAQMAYYMLVRGGLDENRVKSIEGFADRNLKVPDNPEAAANRRIEILLTETPA